MTETKQETKAKFPRVVYHEKLGAKKVHNQLELDALGEGWSDTPSPVSTDPPPAPVDVGVTSRLDGIEARLKALETHSGSGGGLGLGSRPAIPAQPPAQPKTK